MPTLFPSRRIDDPRDLRVISALQAVGAGRSTVQLPTMADSFRADLRAQLVAVAPRLVAEGVQPGTETAPRRSTSRRAGATGSAPATYRGRTTGRPRTRPMTVLVAGAAVVVLGLGGATWLARGALPGDALYGLKRTAEGVDVSLSGSDLDKGHALLVGAQTRVDEVNQLLARPQSMSLGTGTSAAGGLSDSTVQLVVSTLATADSDTQKGVTLIGDDAIARGDHAGLDLVVAWAAGQRDRIDALLARIPAAGAAHDQAARSAANIRTGLDRAEQLQTDYTDKACRRARDAFGPTPCLATSTPSPSGRPTAAPTGAPTSGTSTPAPGGGGGSGSGATSGPTAGAPTATASATPSAGTTRGVGRPRSSSPAPVLSVGSCGVVVVGVSLGTCTPQAGSASR